MKRSTNAPRHFLDIDRIEAGTLRRILDMARAMKKAGKVYKYVTFEADDHYLQDAATRVQMLTEIEVFLAANIGH